jgi:hypothetical protein
MSKSSVDVKDRDTLNVELFYPTGTHAQHVEIGLMHVRASDGIRVTYDFERDGWIIEQPTKLCWTSAEVPDMGWKEVAFVQSWQLEAEQQEQEAKVMGDDDEQQTKG